MDELVRMESVVCACVCVLTAQIERAVSGTLKSAYHHNVLTDVCVCKVQLFTVSYPFLPL